MPDAEHPPPLAGLRGAVSFLTQVPIGNGSGVGGADVGRGAVFFPLIGAAVGAAVAVSAWLASLVAPPAVAAVIAVGVGAFLTGAIHVDGLADTLDGYGGRGRARTLAIMRDHAIGSYGVVGIVVDLGLRAAIIASLLPRSHLLLFLVAAGALSRSAAVGLGSLLPHARVEGGHAGVLEGVGRRQAGIALLIGAGIALLCLGWIVLPAVAVVGAAAALWGWHCLRRLGGVTGDTLGAASEGAELLVLLLAVLIR
jgi:adenosylcobinamide-GDP ribazoletransferase